MATRRLGGLSRGRISPRSPEGPRGTTTDHSMGKKDAADVLDLDIRKYKKQLERLEVKDGNEKNIRDIKSRLALAEKKLTEINSKRSALPASVSSMFHFKRTDPTQLH